MGRTGSVTHLKTPFSHWNIPIMFFTQMSRRREAKRGFFSDDYALLSPCNLSIVLGFFSLAVLKTSGHFSFFHYLSSMGKTFHEGKIFCEGKTFHEGKNGQEKKSGKKGWENLL